MPIGLRRYFAGIPKNAEAAEQSTAAHEAAQLSGQDVNTFTNACHPDAEFFVDAEGSFGMSVHALHLPTKRWQRH